MEGHWGRPHILAHDHELLTPMKTSRAYVAVALGAVLSGLVAYVLVRFIGSNGFPEGLIQANGRIEGDHVTVASKFPGRLVELAAREGARVAKGDVLIVDWQNYLIRKVSFGPVPAISPGGVVNAASGEDCLVYRGGEHPPALMFQRRTSHHGWTNARPLFCQRIRPGYTYYCGQVAAAPDGSNLAHGELRRGAAASAATREWAARS